jgi:hypothetical protein
MRFSAPWLALSVPTVLPGVWLLFRTSVSLITKLRQSIVLSLPLVPIQTVSFPLDGRLALSLEGRRGSNLAGLDFDLRDSAGSAVELHKVLLKTTVSGGARVRLQVRSLILPHDGSYLLNISGMRPDLDLENRVVFSRPIGGILFRHVLVLVALGILTLGSLVLSILLLVRHR